MTSPMTSPTPSAPERLGAAVAKYEDLARVERKCVRCGNLYEGFTFAQMKVPTVTLEDGRQVPAGKCGPCCVAFDLEHLQKDLKVEVSFYSQQLKLAEKARDQRGALNGLERALRRLRDATPDDAERARYEEKRRTVQARLADVNRAIAGGKG